MILVTQKKNKIKIGSLVGNNWNRYDTCLWTNKTGIVLREYTGGPRVPLEFDWLASVRQDNVLFFIITNSDFTDCLQDKNWVVHWFNVSHHPIQVFAENALKVILE